METKVLMRFTNHEDGVSSELAQITGGYSVILRDDDSGNALPLVYRFNTLAAAIAKAAHLVGVAPPEPKVSECCNLEMSS